MTDRLPLTKIAFNVAIEDSRIEVETLWAESLGEGLYRLG